MRVAALYDIHGNLPALEAVLHDVREAVVDLVVIGGDVVPGPMPREVLTRLLHLDVPTRFITGNGEREVLASIAGIETGNVPERFRNMIRWVGIQVGADFAAELSSWPPTLRVTIPDLGPVLFCHATPRNDTEIFTRLTSEEKLRPLFDGLDERVIVCGHTHMQFDRHVGHTRVVNAGSVGMPFGERGAWWVLLGPDVELRHTAYDLEHAAERIRTSDYPLAHDFADTDILAPRSEADTLALFARAELE